MTIKIGKSCFKIDFAGERKFCFVGVTNHGQGDEEKERRGTKGQAEYS